jgi:hypothetical protein
MNSEAELENDTFAAAVSEAIPDETKQQVKSEPAAKVEQTKTEPKKADTVKTEAAKEEKAELDNPNLAPVVVKKEPTEAEQDIKPAGMKEATWIDFKKVRTERNEAQKERDTFKSEIETLKKQMADQGKTSKELEDLKKELQATKEQLTGYESEITVTRVEATPKFKKEITAPMTEIKTSAEEIAKRYEVPADVLLRAIQEQDPGKAADLLEEATSEFKGVDRMELVQMARDYRRIQKNADELRKNAGQQLEALTREQQQAQERASTKTVADYRNAVSEQFTALQEHVPVLRKVEGKDQWNSHVDSLKKRMEDINVNDLEVGEVAKLAAAHVALPEVLSALKYISKERDELKTKLDAAETRLAKFKKTEPAAGGGRIGGDNNGNRSSYTPFEEAVGADA